MKRALLALALGACASGASGPRGAPADRAAATAASAAGPGGRVPRRLDADQLRAALIAATGFSWVGPHRVSRPDSPSGYEDIGDADMIEVLSATLGRADYVTTTSDAIDPAITFTKLAGDAARSACRSSVKADLAEPSPSRHRILRFVTTGGASAGDGAAVRHNLSYLALRFWGRTIPPDDAELTPLATLFDRASVASPADGWRAVCIALATDPQFLTY